MTMKPVFIGIGEVLWDVLPDGRQPGGAPGNFIFHSTILGAEGITVSSIGDDSDGDDLIEHFNSLGLESRFLARNNNFPTGTVQVELDAGGEPDYTITENVAWDHIPGSILPAEITNRASVICFGSLAQRNSESAESISSLLNSVPENTLRIFDINIRQHYYTANILRRSLTVSDILKLNRDELVLLSDMFNLTGSNKEILDALLKKFELKMIALTRDSDGSILHSEDFHLEHPGVRTEVTDAVGAGDAFTATLAMGLVKKCPVELIHDHANRVAAWVCTQPGATPVLPDGLRTA